MGDFSGGCRAGARGALFFTAAAIMLAAPLLAQRLPPRPSPPAQVSTPASAPAPASPISAPTPSVSPAAPAPQPDPLIAGHDLEVGKFYFQRGDYVGALARFQDAIYNDPTSAEAYCRAGDTELKLKHRLPARGDWQRCLRAASDQPHGAWARHAREALAQHPLQPASPPS